MQTVYQDNLVLFKMKWSGIQLPFTNLKIIEWYQYFIPFAEFDQMFSDKIQIIEQLLDKVDNLIVRLKSMVMESAGPHDSPLVQKPDILFGTLPIFVLVAMLVLVAEWVLRRRMNMM